MDPLRDLRLLHESQPFQIVNVPVGLVLQHDLERLSTEGFAARMITDGYSPAVWVQIEAMRTGLTIQYEAVADQRGREFARG